MYEQRSTATFWNTGRLGADFFNYWLLGVVWVVVLALSTLKENIINITVNPWPINRLKDEPSAWSQQIPGVTHGVETKPVAASYLK